MSTLERAIQIAAAAHAGQLDKAGDPYILHPLRVMLHMHSEHERIAAVLHDAVEDTSVTLAQLADEEGFPAAVIEALRALTKLPGESRLEAAARAAENPLALAVKLADNSDNMDLSRIAQPTEKDRARWEEYKTVRTLLLQASLAAQSVHSTEQREILEEERLCFPHHLRPDRAELVLRRA